MRLGSHRALAGAIDNGQWTMDNGQWIMDNGQWIMDNGKWAMDNGKWLNVIGYSLIGCNRALAGNNVF